MSTPSIPTPRFALGDQVAASAQGEVIGLFLRDDGPFYMVAVATPSGRMRNQVFAEHQLALLSAGDAP